MWVGPTELFPDRYALIWIEQGDIRWGIKIISLDKPRDGILTARDRVRVSSFVVSGETRQGQWRLKTQTGSVYYLKPFEGPLPASVQAQADLWIRRAWSDPQWQVKQVQLGQLSAYVNEE